MEEITVVRQQTNVERGKVKPHGYFTLRADCP
jgi:hypothetical protein